MEGLITKLYALAEESAEALEVEVDDVDLHEGGGRAILRITLDKLGGVTLGDCETFSRDFSALLDVDDPLEGKFTLEVSSPGLDRPLGKLSHWQKSIGKLAKVVVKEKIDDQRKLVGRIIGVSEDQVELEVDGQTIKVGFNNIKRARLEVEF